MKYSLFCLYDRVTEEFGAPMLAKNTGHIVRLLKERLKGNKDAFEYDLYQIGSFDVSTGFLEPLETKKLVHLGIAQSFESDSEGVNNG